MWLDHQYIGTISVRLEKFSRKGDYLYNFRCPICGDSQTNRNKARGYIFPQKGGMFFKCHNCQASLTLGNLIKHVDPNLYKQYCLDRYKEGDTGRKAHKAHNYVFKPVVFESNRQDNAFRGLLSPLKKMAADSEVIDYVRSRKIPEHRYEDLYFVDDISKFKQFAEGYDEKIVGDEPRLVLPFFDENDDLVGLSGRALRGEKIRYVTIRIKDDAPMIFNLNNVNKDQTIYVTEGPIDSLFLPNSVAVGNANLKSVGDYLPKDNIVLVYDNEPRNKEIVREIKTAIELGFSVVIWPDNIMEKDINDMVMNGKMSADEIVNTINKNTFRGPMALLNFNNWKHT
jgi:transcription elongation factor Elf1